MLHCGLPGSALDERVDQSKPKSFNSKTTTKKLTQAVNLEALKKHSKSSSKPLKSNCRCCKMDVLLSDINQAGLGR
jgi:Tfp pilus assembly protein PilO